MYIIPLKIGWESVKNYDEQGLPDEYEVLWADNDDNLTDKQALCFCDVLSKENKEVETIMNFEQFQAYCEKFYSNIHSLHPLEL